MPVVGVDHVDWDTPELYLRLLVEDAITVDPADFRAVSQHLARIATDGRALRAVGAVGADVVAALVAETELALYLRGADWLAIILSDLPSLTTHREGTATSRLVSVVAAGDALVEVWDDALTVRTVGSMSWTTPGGVPDGHERLEVRTSTGTALFDLSPAAAVRRRPARVRPVSFVDTLLTWAVVAQPLAIAPDPSAGQRSAGEGFEAIAISSGDVDVMAIERGQVLHARLRHRPAVAWIRSPAGIHVVGDGLVIDPPVPEAPAPITLVLVDDGQVTEIDLRP